MDSTLYVGPSPEKITTSPMQIETIPYYKATHTQRLQAADTVEFESPNYYDDMSHLYMTGDHLPFGGQIWKRTVKTDGYSYEAVDFSRLLFGKCSFSYENILTSDVVKKLLNEVGLPTSGVQSTEKEHALLAVNNKKRNDVCHQMANLESGWEFYINTDGIPIYRPEPIATSGYVFISEKSVADYNLDYDATDIVTGVQVFGSEDTLLYSYYDDLLTQVFGRLDEIISDSNITTQDEAKAKADTLFKEKGKVKFTGELNIPEIIPISKGEWCIFLPPDSNTPVKAYYVNEVKSNLDDSTRETVISLLDGKPSPPSEWVYEDPSCNSSGSSSSGGSVCGVMKPICGTCGLPYQNHSSCVSKVCPGCGQSLIQVTNKRLAGESEATCYTCGPGDGKGNQDDVGCNRDYCICGTECDYGHTTHLTVISGPTVSSQAAGESSSTGSTKCIATTSIDGVDLPNLLSPSSIRQWIDTNIKYEFYYNNKYTISQVLQYKRGNCYDQSALAVALLQAAGYTASRVCGKNCGGYSHCNVEVVVNGAVKVMDTTCSALNEV